MGTGTGPACDRGEADGFGSDRPLCPEPPGAEDDVAGELPSGAGDADCVGAGDCVGSGSLGSDGVGSGMLGSEGRGSGGRLGSSDPGTAGLGFVDARAGAGVSSATATVTAVPVTKGTASTAVVFHSAAGDWDRAGLPARWGRRERCRFAIKHGSLPAVGRSREDGALSRKNNGNTEI